MAPINNIIKATIWIVILAGTAFGILQYYQYIQPGEQQTPEDAVSDEMPPRVRAVKVKTGTLEQKAFITGNIQPDSRARVMPEISGVLEKFQLSDGTPLEEGQEVQQGDQLGVVEHEDLKAALEEARASLQVAKSSLQESRVQLEDAEREKKRMLALYKDGTATEQQRDRALTAYQSAVARVDLAQKRVEQAQATLHKARVRYNDATIKAPITGVISTKYVDEGSHVDPATCILEIVNIDHVEVEGGVAGKYFPLIKPGKTRARVEVDAYRDDVFEGKVDRVQPELDPQTRTAKVTVRIDNENNRLKPGMFARMEIIVKRREEVTVIPDSALMQSGNNYSAFMINGGKAHLRKVQIGLEEAADNEVLDGVKPGDMVVVRGIHLLKDGINVRFEEVTQ